MAPNSFTASLRNYLNQVFDRGMERRWPFEVWIPVNVFKFLHFVSLLAVGVMGFYFSLSRHRHDVLSSVLIFAFTASMPLIFDLDQPRTGKIMIEQSPLYWTLESLGGEGEISK